MKYTFMLLIAFSMAIISSLLTAFGMTELFSSQGELILVMFVLIDLGRFLLFNFVVDEWHNLRKVKYFIVFILGLLFLYSGVGIFSKLDSLLSGETRKAMINIASLMKAEDNANIKQNRSEDLASIARKEYDDTMEWNKLDYDNCIKRANKNPYQENNCNNTKRRLDKAASASLQDALAKADEALSGSEEVVLNNSLNKSEVSSILLTICKLSQKECKNYDDLQLALSILIFLVIIGTDYLQIAIVLAVNTRKNKLKIEKNNVQNSVVFDNKNVGNHDNFSKKFVAETSGYNNHVEHSHFDKSKNEEIEQVIENKENFTKDKDEILSKKANYYEYYKF